MEKFMSRAGLLISTAVALALLGLGVVWWPQGPCGLAFARDFGVVQRFCTPRPDYMTKRFCVQKHVTVLDAEVMRLETVPCDEWHQP